MSEEVDEAMRAAREKGKWRKADPASYDTGLADAYAAGLAAGERRGLERAAAMIEQEAQNLLRVYPGIGGRPTEPSAGDKAEAGADRSRARRIRALIKEPTT